MSEGWKNFRDGLAGSLAGAASGHVQEAIRSRIPAEIQPAPAPGVAAWTPDLGQAARKNPEPDEPFDDDFGPAHEIPTQSEIAFAFETPGQAASNLKAAYGIAQIRSHDTVYVHAPTGIAFTGGRGALNHYCEDHALATDGWKEHDRAEIDSKPGDRSYARHLLREAESSGFKDAGKRYEGFHWDATVKVLSVRDIPGVGDEYLEYLGVCREILFSQGKGNFKLDLQGNKLVFPWVYALEGKLLLVHGLEYDRKLLDVLKKATKKGEEGDYPSDPITRELLEGLDGKLQPIGPAWEICYGSKKSGKWREYYHEIGEVSDTYPTLWLLDDTVLVIAGGGMHVIDAGIDD